MKQTSKSWMYFAAGAGELLIGLALSLYIGIQISWGWALILALTFFVSANVLFFQGLKRS